MARIGWALALWLSAASTLAQPLGPAGAKLLLTRAGFAPNAEEIRSFAQLDARSAAASRSCRCCAPDGAG
jgi:hypothetical protein